MDKNEAPKDGPRQGPLEEHKHEPNVMVAGSGARGSRRGRVLKVLGGLFLLGLVVFAVLWQRCGIKGCPDVDMLRGYMPEEASQVVDRNGEEIAKLFVTRRTVIGIDSIPKHVQDAFIAIEDRRFREHGGVDWRRVAGALLSNVKAGGIAEGGSTITMQLARNVFPDKLPATEKSPFRKLGEARVARAIEKRYSKDEILELYLNQIYFGQGAYGLEAAAQEYYGKGATKLTLAEGATLAALPRAPSRLNPRSNPDAAREGRALVLERMAEQGMISAEERDQASEEKLRLRRREAKSQDRAPYFVEAVRRRLEEQLGDAIYTEGYVIHTTLDLAAQRAAENALSAQLRAIEGGTYGGYPHPTYASVKADTTADSAEGTPYLQGAMIVMEAATGDVLALIGGRDYDDSEFNRATQAQRQPGSAFKPFVYAAALQSGLPPTHRLLDQPLRMVIDRGTVWEPKNYDGTYAGAVSMRQALTHSKNVATVRLASEVGLGQVLGLAENMGLGSMPSNPSVVLGTAEVTPIQLTSAFSGFATLGSRAEPRYVTRVEDRNGQTVWAEQSSTHRVIDPAVAFLTVSMMQDVINRGTGTGVRAVGFRGAAAGKTGTTQDASDVWFVGITPELVGTVWIGFDKRQRILRGATGGEIAAPVWGRVMRAIGAGKSDWPVPGGVEQRTVTAMGGIVGENCPAGEGAYTEYFLAGSVPSGDCYPDQYLAYYDTLGNTTADSIWQDYERRRTDEAGWWARLRGRLFGRDSLGVPRNSTDPGDTLPVVPVQPQAPPTQTQPVPVQTPPVQSQPVQSQPVPAQPVPVQPPPGQVTPRPTGPPPLGTPVRPRPDTLPKPRPDTLPAYRG